MKKTIALLLCLVMLAALAACGAQNTEGQAQQTAQTNEITGLLDSGYTTWMTSFDESSWAAVFQKGDDWSSVYLVKAAMTPEQYEALNSLDFCDDDYDAQLAELLGQLDDVTVTDITDKVPTAEDLARFVGMTMGELEAAGFEKTGYSCDEESGIRFYYDGADYDLLVFPADADDITDTEDLDNYSENDLRAFKIASVEFAGFAFGILEE